MCSEDEEKQTLRIDSYYKGLAISEEHSGTQHMDDSRKM